MMQYNNELEIVNRITYLPGELGVKKYDFIKSIGKDSNFLARLEQGEIRISEELLNTICEVYPKVNKEWVLTGDGKSTNRTQ